MQESIDTDKKRKRFLFVLCSSVTILAIVVLAIYNVMNHGMREIKISIVLVSIIVTAYIALKKFDADILIYRICLFLLCLSLFYSVPNGAGQGTSLYWIYILPLLFFFFFGKREGLIWFMVFASCLFFVILTPSVFGWYSYGYPTVLRFIVTLGIVTMVGYGLESSRDRSHTLLVEKNKALLQEKQLLEQAMSEIKTLSGFIPICSNCKKIRNDDGYWEQLESYIKDHSGADFSHSICPDCIVKLYPEFKQFAERKYTS